MVLTIIKKLFVLFALEKRLEIDLRHKFKALTKTNQNVGGYHDKRMHIHATSPQLLNEMIQYADENDIMRSRDMIIRKVITEQGEVRFPTFSSTFRIIS